MSPRSKKLCKKCQKMPKNPPKFFIQSIIIEDLIVTRLTNLENDPNWTCCYLRTSPRTMKSSENNFSRKDCTETRRRGAEEEEGGEGEGWNSDRMFLVLTTASQITFECSVLKGLKTKPPPNKYIAAWALNIRCRCLSGN